jgi:hypothetical protein
MDHTINAGDIFIQAMDVVITVEKVRAPNANRRSGAPHMYWPHVWWLLQAVERGVDCMMR